MDSFEVNIHWREGWGSLIWTVNSSRTMEGTGPRIRSKENNMSRSSKKGKFRSKVQGKAIT
jgi:hypothetical protein